jgi:flagellar basal body P-ring formation protein FlgA
MTRTPLFAALFATLVLAAAPARAQALPDEAALRAFAQPHAAAAAAAAGATRIEVQLHPAPPRTALAPCSRTEPFWPPQPRPWGRVAVGLRCVEGAGWTLMVPATVRAWGPALVAAVPLAAGAPVAAQDVAVQEIELTREAPGLLRDAAALGARVLQRPLAPGQPLRTDALRAVLAVQAGDPVRLRIQGAGFAVSGAGVALAAAADGQPVRVRTDLGRVLTGTARDGRVVDVLL